VSRLRDALARGEFVVTGEVAPPHGTDTSAMLASARTLAPVCHALNVTDNQAATLHMSSFAAARLLLDSGCGCDPVLQLTCRDRNRLALQSDLLGAWALGLENVLVLSGDDPRGGDHPKAKGVFDLDSTLLMQVISGLNSGVDMVGAPLEGATDFMIGGALFPEMEPWEIQLERALQKVDAGTTFFQTQGVTDLDKFARAAEAIRPTGAKVIAGIVLFKSPGVIKFINERLAGMMVPESISDRICAAADPLAESILVAAEQIRELRGIADGVHIMPLGADGAVARILEHAGIA
jgi:methylenetetrahydrofolate reductase (NADPH)